MYPWCCEKERATLPVMPQASYRGLPEYGLPIIAPGDEKYEQLVNDILSRPQPFPSWSAEDRSDAAVLVNQSGKAIIGATYVWQYTMPDGRTTRHIGSNLGSSMQFDVLTGRAAVGEDLCTFILPQSKRLITKRGMIGSNLDVLPHLASRLGGFSGSGSGGRAVGDAYAKADLTLDMVILEDGLCVGPDELNTVGELQSALREQAALASIAVEKLRTGATPGQILDLIRPMAQRQRSGGSQSFAGTFVNMALHQLVHSTTGEILVWFEQAASISVDRLHRA